MTQYSDLLHRIVTESRNFDLHAAALPMFGCSIESIIKNLEFSLSPKYNFDMSNPEGDAEMYYSPEIDGEKCDTPWLTLYNSMKALTDEVKELRKEVQELSGKAKKVKRKFVDYLLHDADKREKAMAFLHEKLDYMKGKIVAITIAAAIRAKAIVDTTFKWVCVKDEFNIQCKTDAITRYYNKDNDDLKKENIIKAVYDLQILIRQVVFGDANPYVVITKKQ